MKKTLVMLLAMWITASVWGKDNNHTFLHVNNEMGLSQSNVKAIVQDRTVTIEFDESLLQQGGYDLEVTPFNVGK